LSHNDYNSVITIITRVIAIITPVIAIIT
jgi:hypothetical protein